MVVLAPAVARADVTTSGTITLVNSDPLTQIGAPVGGTLPKATADYSASDAIVDLIDNTPAGASIRLADYDIHPDDDGGVIPALNNAAARGVDVAVVLDHQHNSGRNEDAAAALDSAVDVTLCEWACINTTGNTVPGVGTPGIAHSKFVLFSQTTDPAGTIRTDVVADGSQNFNRQQFIIHNNWVVSYDDPALYTGFTNFWDALHAQDATPDNPAVQATVTSSTGRIKTFFYPRPAASDPVADFVNELDCSKGGQIYGESSTWDSDRTAVNNALIAQADAGCEIQLMMDDVDGPADNDGSDSSELALAAGTNHPMNSNIFATHGITVYGTAPGGCRYSTEGSYNHYCAFTGGGTHEKYLVIVGKTPAGADVKRVISGSDNFAQRALTSYTETDEEIRDATVAQGFLDDFNRQKAEAATINPDKYPNATYSTVNSSATGSQDEPGIARAGGYTAVAWANSSGASPPSCAYSAIYLKLSRSDGSTVYEVPIQSQSSSGSHYCAPTVGLDGSGNAVVAWQDDNDGNGSYDIVMRQITNNGTASPAIGSRVTVNADSSGQQTSPSLAMTPDGHFSVAWTDAASGNTEIRLANFSAVASKVTELQANGTSTGSHSQSDVAVYPTTGGNWTTIVVWNDDSDGNGSGEIHGRALTSTGSNVWAEKSLNSVSSGDQTVPAVSANASGFIVAWETYTGDPATRCHTYALLPGEPAPTGHEHVPAQDTARCVQVREFAASGAPTATEFEVSKGLFDTNAYTTNANIGDQRGPSVAIDDAGHYVVAWQELTPLHPGWDVFARSFTPGGGSTADTLSEYRMNPIIPNRQLSPRVATDGAGNFVLVYDDDADRNGSTQLVERDGFTIG